MSNNEYFSKMHIWLRIIVLRLFSAQQRSLLSHASPTPDCKMDIF